MKRISAVLLLLALTVVGSLPLQAQRISPQENARQSQRAAKSQQKMLKHANKKQRKNAKKYEKTQRKQMKKANKTNKKNIQSVRR
jgi:Tfp pilus assembly protein PilV